MVAPDAAQKSRDLSYFIEQLIRPLPENTGSGSQDAGLGVQPVEAGRVTQIAFRGRREVNKAILKQVVPSVQLAAGFLDCGADGLALNDDGMRRAIAGAVARGVQKYFEKYPLTEEKKKYQSYVYDQKRYRESKEARAGEWRPGTQAGLKGLRVEAYATATASSASAQPVASATSADDGSFEIELPASGSYALKVVGPEATLAAYRPESLQAPCPRPSEGSSTRVSTLCMLELVPKDYDPAAATTPASNPASSTSTNPQSSDNPTTSAPDSTLSPSSSTTSPTTTPVPRQPELLNEAEIASLERPLGVGSPTPEPPLRNPSSNPQTPSSPAPGSTPTNPNAPRNSDSSGGPSVFQNIATPTGPNGDTSPIGEDPSAASSKGGCQLSPALASSARGALLPWMIWLLFGWAVQRQALRRRRSPMPTRSPRR